MQGDLTAVEIVANQASISEVLNALTAKLYFRYDTSTDLDGVINGIYSGPLEHVLPRVLRGVGSYISSTPVAVQELDGTVRMQPPSA